MVKRSGKTQALWWLLWLVWIVYVGQQVIDVARFNAPWPVWLLRIAPLVLFVPGVARDNLRAVIWLCFVVLFYFISSVEALFAQPSDLVAVVGIVAVVALFISATLYIRFRGRELKLATSKGQNKEGSQ